MKLALLLVLPTLVACPRKEEAAATRERANEPERPTPVPRESASVPIHSLLSEAKSKVLGQEPWRIDIDYIRADGSIDPAYGEVEVWSRPPRGPEDDPQRPTGAPVKPTPKRPYSMCHHLTWKEGVWSDASVNCTTNEQRLDLRCTVPIVWERAIAMGAPRDAVAKLSITASESARWTFKIEDTVRDVRFNAAFADDCGLVVEAPDPTVGPDTVPDEIDRTMIKNTIGTVKADIRACASGARGTVKLLVRVKSDGTATAAIKETPAPELGECVRAIVERAKFPATSNGGSFSYPFVF